MFSIFDEMNYWLSGGRPEPPAPAPAPEQVVWPRGYTPQTLAQALGDFHYRDLGWPPEHYRDLGWPSQ